MLALLAQEVANAAHAALASLASVKHLLPSTKPWEDGAAALRAAHRVMGRPPPKLPPELRKTAVRARRAPRPKLEESGVVHIIPSTVRVRRKKGAAEVKARPPVLTWDEDPALEASRCRALLLEVIRRAVHDWVLYRQHEKRQLKLLAQAAYVWLFEEGPDHAHWRERQQAAFDVRGEQVKGARALTSFLSICDAVGLIPEDVRKRARAMTPESILRAGRPAERRPARDESVSIEEYGVWTDVDLNSLDDPSEFGDYSLRSAYG